MEKVKINLSGFTMKSNELEIGDGIRVKDRIPYTEKEQFATEYVEGVIVPDGKLGICYETYAQNQVWNYLFIRYYTNIDVEEGTDLTVLFDYAQDIGLMGECVREHVKDDLRIVSEIVCSYRDSVEQLYQKGHSLENMVKELLSSDVDTNMAETRELIEKLTDMKGALIEKEERDNVISFGKKKSANIKAGGVKLNQAKK